VANRKSISRRQFMKRTASVAIGGFAFPYVVPSSVLGRSTDVAPSNKIAVGCVGVGNQGTSDMHSFLEQDDTRVVAVCDKNARQCNAKSLAPVVLSLFMAVEISPHFQVNDRRSFLMGQGVLAKHTWDHRDI